MKISKKFMIVLIILVILLLGVAIFGYYIKKNDKTSYGVFVDTFDNFLNIIDNQIDTNSNSIEGNITLESNSISYNENKILLNMIGGNNIDLDFKINYDKKYIMLDMNTFYTGVDPINIKKYYDGTYEYSYIENYYNNKFTRRNLFVDEYNSFVNNIKISNDYRNIIYGIKDAILSKENSKFFGWTEQKITIGKDEYNTYNNYFSINKNNYNEIFKNINSALKNDKNFIKSYKNIFKKDYNIKDYSEFVNWFLNNNIDINIYSDVLNNDFLKLVLTINNKDDSSKSISIELYKENDKYKFQILKNIYTFNGDISIGKNKGEINISIPAENSETLKMKFKYNLTYKNDITFEKIDNYVDRYDVLDEVGEVYQAMMDRREITNAYNLYQIYLYETQDNN